MIINEEELKVFEAMKVIAEYRSKEGGFELLCNFFQLIFKIISTKQECPKCGHEFDIYVPTK